MSGPTAIVAGVVLAVGLLAFLTIRPVTSTQPAAEAAAAAALPHGVAVPVPGDDGAALAVVTPELVQAVPSDAVAGSTPAVGEDPTSVDAMPDPSTSSDVVAPDSSTSGVETPEPVISASPDAAADAQATVVAAAPEPVATPVETASPNGSPPLTHGFGSLGASDAPLDAQALEWITPAGSPPAPPLALPPLASHQAPALSYPAQRHEEAESRETHPPSGTASTSRVSSSTGAKRAALDPSPVGRAEAARSRSSPSWLRKLRAELRACEGNLIVRTVCEETAKLRHCTSANAWGEIPECPAARLPDLATFN